ncbi:MAG TPA: hypothetical protein VI913_04650 [Candidatus Peribacteraceae bacterium]|nr:hypothetical protein [Candidatus Peribacteraceae bacterium]
MEREDYYPPDISNIAENDPPPLVIQERILAVQQKWNHTTRSERINAATHLKRGKGDDAVSLKHSYSAPLNDPINMADERMNGRIM